jgi:hypothetical protein
MADADDIVIEALLDNTFDPQMLTGTDRARGLVASRARCLMIRHTRDRSSDHCLKGRVTFTPMASKRSTLPRGRGVYPFTVAGAVLRRVA